jgi:hypothetical protein
MGIFEARPAELGVAKSRIPLFPPLTEAAAVRKGALSGVPTQRPMVNRGRRCLFRAEYHFPEPAPVIIGSPRGGKSRCFVFSLALRLLIRPNTAADGPDRQSQAPI